MSTSYEQITTGEIIAAGITTRKGTETVSVLIKDSVEDILLCTGTTMPTDATDGYAKGCLFIDTDVATGTSGLYVNVGTKDACVFKLVTNA